MFHFIKNYFKTLVPNMAAAHWEYLEQRFTIQHLKKGAFLTRSGEVCNKVSFINKGMIRMYYLVDGKEICTGFVPEQNYIAEYESFLTRKPAKAFVDVLEDCELINLSYDDVQAAYNIHPVLETFGRKIAELLFIMGSVQTSRLLTLSPEERYATVLQYEPYIIQRVPQYMIASYIGITPEHLSRIRKKRSGKQNTL